jgi:hypothetical protein
MWVMTLVDVVDSSASSARRFTSASVPAARTSALSRNTRARMSSRSLRDTVSCAQVPGVSLVMTGGMVEPSHMDGPADVFGGMCRRDLETRRVGRARRGEDDDTGAVVLGAASPELIVVDS